MIQRNGEDITSEGSGAPCGCEGAAAPGRGRRKAVRCACADSIAGPEPRGDQGRAGANLAPVVRGAHGRTCVGPAHPRKGQSQPPRGGDWPRASHRCRTKMGGAPVLPTEVEKPPARWSLKQLLGAAQRPWEPGPARLVRPQVLGCGPGSSPGARALPHRVERNKSHSELPRCGFTVYPLTPPPPPMQSPTLSSPLIKTQGGTWGQEALHISWQGPEPAPKDGNKSLL